jgi:hypothetical protein
MWKVLFSGFSLLGSLELGRSVASDIIIFSSNDFLERAGTMTCVIERIHYNKPQPDDFVAVEQGEHIDKAGIGDQSF